MQNHWGRVVGGLFISAFLFYGGAAFLDYSATGDAPAVPENDDLLGQLCAVPATAG